MSNNCVVIKIMRSKKHHQPKLLCLPPTKPFIYRSYPLPDWDGDVVDECIIKESSPEMRKIDRKREWSIISEWNAFAIVLFHSALWRIFSYHINPFIIGRPMPLFKAIRYPSGKYTTLTLPSAMPMDMPDVLDFHKSFRNTTSTKVLKCAAKNNIFFQMEFFDLQKRRSRKAKLCRVEKKCWCQK